MFEFKTEDPFITSLACAALNPALRSILVFDAPYPVLQDIADILAQMLKAATGQQVEQGNIAIEQDDDVWGSLPLPDSEEHSAAVKQIFKLFSRERNADKMQVLTIADLARLSLAMARTCTMLIGADIAYLERNGEHDQWQLQQCWLASCSRKEIGAISPHLLDRFAVRLSWQPIAKNTRQRKIDNLRTFIHDQFTRSTQLPIELLQRITDAAQRQVDFTAVAFSRVMDYIPIESYYPRRELALARFAQSLARLHGDAQVTSEHVDKAAAMLGFVEIETPVEDKQLSTEPMPEQAPVELERTIQPTQQTQSLQTTQPEPSDTLTAKIQEPITPEALLVSGLIPNPYPEDEAPIEREAASLKVPHPRFSTARSDRGPIFGVEQADTLQDLAIVSTLQTAVMFQEVRKQEQEKKHTLLIEKSDLRHYRRGFISERMLLLLLDYTCLQSCNWQEALLPYLQEAYADRASITIVKVGAADASDPWRAEMVSGRNILVPKIEIALEAQRGKTTPLAHGLELALEILHRALQQGRSAVQQVTFVIISDGRGNVPLEASHKKKTRAIVTREGIDDALRVAQMIREVKRVEKIVLNPQPRYYAQLPELLAQALGATVENIPRRFDGLEGIR